MLDIWLPNRSVEEAMQKSNHQDAKLQLSEYKVTPIMVQSCNFRSVKLQTSKCNSKFFRFQLSIFSNHQHPTLHQKASRLKLHNYTVCVYIYAVLGILKTSNC